MVCGATEKARFKNVVPITQAAQKNIAISRSGLVLFFRSNVFKERIVTSYIFPVSCRIRITVAGEDAHIRLMAVVKMPTTEKRDKILIMQRPPC